MENLVDRFNDEVGSIEDGYGEKTYPTEIKTPSNTSNVLRLLDGSNSFRKYWISWFICDDDQIRPFIIENEHQGKGVLARMLGDSDNYYKGGYLESKKGQFGKIHIHQQKDPELFKRMTEYWNPSYNGTGTSRPKKEFVYNALHRNPETVDSKIIVWCRENQHTKLIRFGQKAFKALKIVRDNCGDFDAYDIVYSKQGTGSDTVFSVMKGDIGTQHNVVGPLSDEEKAYERYDLDFITALASANYVLKNLRNQIERISNVVGISFLDELEKQLTIENAEYEAAKNAQAGQSTRVDQIVATTITAAQPPVQPSVPEQESAIAAPHTVSTQIVPPSVQASVASGALPQRQPISAAVAEQPIVTQDQVPCGHCRQLILADSKVCPKCNGLLLSDCDTCHKPFSVFATTCPHCGQSYQTT